MYGKTANRYKPLTVESSSVLRIFLVDALTAALSDAAILANPMVTLHNLNDHDVCCLHPTDQITDTDM